MVYLPRLIIIIVVPSRRQSIDRGRSSESQQSECKFNHRDERTGRVYPGRSEHNNEGD